MKAARVVDGRVCVSDVPVPEPGPDEALVRITAAGVCHSDLDLARGEWAGVRPASVIGHEAIGVVEALGAGGERVVDVGNRVILGLGSAGGAYWCGACEYCLRGSPRHCPQTKPVLGTFAEYFSIWAPALVTLPDSVGDLDAPLACGGLTAYGAVKKLLKHEVPPGRPVAVIGAAGGLGHYAVQLAAGFGYEVVGIDIGRDRLDFVTSLGAPRVVDAGDGDDAVCSAVGGVDAALVFTPRIAGFQLGLKLLRPGGLFVGVGVPPTSEGDLRVNPLMFLTKDPTLVYSAVGNIQDMRELVGLAAAGRVRTHVSRRGPLSELDAIFEELDAGSYLGRAVVDDLAN
jgi:propanol-preferring alcohol dehydrogenase